MAEVTAPVTAGGGRSGGEGTGAGSARRLPPVWRVAAGRGGVEVKTFFRDKMAVAFIFGLPSILLILLGSIFKGASATRGVSVAQLFAAGMIAGGIMSTSFQYLGINIASERQNGMLKRLYGTPMPRSAYFAGKVVQVAVCTTSETALLIAVGVLFFHLSLPSSPGRWFTFAWIFVLGAIACSLMGIAASSVPRTSASAAPVITLPFTVLNFMSGVYVPPNDVPAWMRDIASFFPLKWMAQGLRSVFLPDGAKVLEPARAWEHGRTALVLLAWIIVGLILCLRTFRWQSASR
jgi:ABC-2 type transport system permease protein